MRYAIIAAGEGSRLAHEGVREPKPLVKINGECLIDRLIRVFMNNSAEDIVVICNEFMTDVKAHLEDIKHNGLNGVSVPLTIVVKTTPSSMHSFYEISRYIRGGAFCLTTVDTIFKESEFTDFIHAFEEDVRQNKEDGMMVVTDYIDDEKPLYVDVNEQGLITGFLDTQASCHYVSGGIYGLTQRSIKVLDECIARGESRMRNFQRGLIKAGCKLVARPFSKVFDIDHASDIEKAEKFVTEQ